MRLSPFPIIKPSLETISKNTDVRKALVAHGDKGSAIRHVRHFLYPEFFPVRKRDELIIRLQALGFAVASAADDHGLIAEEQREVASADFDSLTESLERMMRDIGWQYDGWECALVKDAPPA